MRKMIVSNLISLDALLEGPNAELDWFQVDDEFRDYSQKMLAVMDTILFGRITYQLMVNYWPTEHAIRTDPKVAEKMNNLQKVVFSRTLSKVDWNNTRLVKDNIAAEAARLKEMPGPEGKNIVILGSGSIVSGFATLGLIDEYWIVLNPLIMGQGKPIKNSAQAAGCAKTGLGGRHPKIPVGEVK